MRIQRLKILRYSVVRGWAWLKDFFHSRKYLSDEFSFDIISVEDKRVHHDKDRPKILLVCDVRGWAWWNKSLYIKKHLSDEFSFDIISVEDKMALLDEGRSNVNLKIYDLCVTYGYRFIDYLKDVPRSKRVTGVTAHRPREVLEPKMKKVVAVHVNSKMLQNELCKMHDKVFYVPNGVDEQLFKPLKEIPKKRENIIVGHVGKLSRRKGQKEFIEPAIKKSGALYKYHYFGSGIPGDQFNAHKDRIPLSKMSALYQDMDVFIVASEEDGTPNPALEAMACGRPVISNKIGNMPEVIVDGYNGFLVERNIDAYVEKINWCRENRDKIIEMGKNARLVIEQDWTWKKQAERYGDMFNTILRRR